MKKRVAKFVEELVEEIRTYPCLWSTSCRSYKEQQKLPCENILKTHGQIYEGLLQEFQIPLSVAVLNIAVEPSTFFFGLSSLLLFP